MIFLVGYMGSGKTSTGRKLANKLNWQFLDLDVLFEEKYRISIANFFSKYDEMLFRTLEHDLLKQNLHHKNMVLSMGGGTPCFHDNMQLLNDNGLTIYIRMSAGALFERLSNAKRPRPVVKDLAGDDLRKHISQQLAERETYYNQAHIIIPGINLDLEELMIQIKKSSTI